MRIKTANLANFITMIDARNFFRSLTQYDETGHSQKKAK